LSSSTQLTVIALSVLFFHYLQVFREPIYRKYHAKPCGCAFLYFLAALVTLLLVPFYLAYDPRTFWAKTALYREQPKVDYTHQLLLLAEGVDADRAPFSAFFSSMATVNSLHQDTDLRVPSIKSRSHDSNSDGSADVITVIAELPMNAGERVLSVKLILLFRTRLREKARLEMDTLAYFQHSSAVPGSSLRVDADYKLRQVSALQARGGYVLPYEDQPLLSPASATTLSETLFSTLLSAYAARNTTMELSGGHFLWQGAAGGSSSTFTVRATLRIPQQDVLYSPPPGEVLRGAWVQYAVMLVLVWVVLDRLSAFVYHNQVVETRVEAPQLPDISGKKQHYH
jgi:Transmembrane protein 231